MKVVFFCRDNVQTVDDVVLALRLRWPDLQPVITSEGSAGLEMIEQEGLELVLLCEDLPDMGIFSAIKEIRRFSDVPIIVAAAGLGDTALVRAIDCGADDYISMPCNLMEVMARVVALLRRVGLTTQGEQETPILCGDLLINPATYEVFLGSNGLALTPTEFKLLHLLAKNRHMTVSQELIQRVIWNDETGAAPTLKKFIQTLRRKLGDDAQNPEWIKTVRGVGYRFSSPVSTEV